jgi:hypothetical protein
VVFEEAPGERVVIGCPEGIVYNCLAVEGQHVTYRGFETVDDSVLGRVNGFPQQGSVCVCRTAYDVTLEDVDAGELYIAGSDVRVLGGDYGPTADRVSKIEYGDGGPPTDVTIDGAAFHDHRRASGHQHVECIAAYSGDRVTIRNSTFDDCEGFSIFLAPGVGGVARNYTIENDVFRNTGGVPSSAAIKTADREAPGPERPPDCSNLLVRNSTFLDDNVASECPGENIRWLSNVYEVMDGCDGAVGEFDYSVQWDDPSVPGAPEECGGHVVKPASLGLGGPDGAHLEPGAAAIGAGDPAESTAFDIDGQPRVAPDAGADEYVPAGSAGWLGTLYALVLEAATSSR